MRFKYSLVLLLFCLVVKYQHADATTGKKQKPSIKLLEASSQRTIPGIPGAQIKTNCHFVVIWNGTEAPDIFLWKNEKGWENCLSVKINGNGSIAVGENIHKGDTLSITTSKEKIEQYPRGIPANTKSSLFYKTKSSGWISFPVKKITRKPDIAMP